MMKAYPEYKATGESFLGDIPNHWVLTKNKFLAKYTKGKNPSELHDDPIAGTLPYLAMDFLRGKNNAPKYAFLTNSTYLVENEQPLIIWDGSNAGEFVSGRRGILSSTMAAAVLSKIISPKFYNYLSIVIEKEMRRSTIGMGIPHVDGSELNNLPLAMPDSIYEQNVIASYLDVEVGSIDNLITEKQNFIKLLSEKRQALISHVVTKGLNPNVPMKDSGVEWIGEIPAHWKVSPIKHYISSVKSGTSVNAGNVPASENEIGVLKTSCVSSGEFNFKQNKTVISEDLDRVTCKVEPGALIVSRMNTPELVGAAGYVRECPDNIYLPDRLWQLNAIENLENEYIHFWTQSPSYRTQVNLCCIGTSDSMQNLSQEKFKNFYIAIPPIEEQIKLIEEVNKQSVLLEKIKSETINSIKLLKEHRTALISAAVTGKIDVREKA